jgi:hypothetical protein
MQESSLKNHGYYQTAGEQIRNERLNSVVEAARQDAISLIQEMEREKNGAPVPPNLKLSDGKIQDIAQAAFERGDITPDEAQEYINVVERVFFRGSVGNGKYIM